MHLVMVELVTHLLSLDTFHNKYQIDFRLNKIQIQRVDNDSHLNRLNIHH